MLKFLSNTSINIVYRAFVEAFSDYQVKIRMTEKKFKEMVKTRDLNLDYSIGYFDDGRMIGFIICGFRDKNGKKYCYDGGTGIIKKYRGKGISKLLLKELIEKFKEKNIDYFILEVLENNEPAVNLYKKHNFKITREFCCYEIDKKDISKENIHNQDEDKFSLDYSFDNYIQLDYQKYMSFDPSWQNDKVSIVNSRENYEYVSLIKNYTTIAYGIIHKKSGSIPQIGILPVWHNRNIEFLIINELKNKTKSNKLTFLNIEKNDYLAGQLEKIGFKNIINQYEMCWINHH